MKLASLRRASRILTILLIIAVPLLNKRGTTFLTGSLYSFAIGPVWLTDPLNGIQVIIADLSANSTLLLSMAIPIAIALIYGRVFCGWICPQNTISELFDVLAERLPAVRKWRAGRGGPRLSGKPRYAIMTVLLVLAPLLGFPVANLFSAPGIISVQTTKFFYEGRVGAELGLIALAVAAEVFIMRRVWCNYICPVGGFLGLFRCRKTMKVVYAEGPGSLCGRCFECVKACRLGLNPMEGDIYPLCHNCGACISACEEMKGASKPLSFRF